MVVNFSDDGDAKQNPLFALGIFTRMIYYGVIGIFYDITGGFLIVSLVLIIRDLHQRDSPPKP